MTAYNGPGASYQYLTWNKSTRKIRIVVSAAPGLSPNRCLDGAIDWQTTGGHYDVRVVRVRRPGYTEQTDPGGDHHWIEPGDWDSRTVTGIRSAAGMNITDSYPFENKAEERWSSARPYQSTSHVAPRTAPDVDYWARVRTIYQAGHTESHNKTPERCFGPGSWVWNCN